MNSEPDFVLSLIEDKYKLSCALLEIKALLPANPKLPLMHQIKEIVEKTLGSDGSVI